LIVVALAPAAMRDAMNGASVASCTWFGSRSPMCGTSKRTWICIVVRHAPFVTLGQVAGGAVAKQRPCMRSACEFQLDVRDFALQAQLGLLDGGLAQGQADAGAAEALVNEVVAVRVDRDVGGTGCRHVWLLSLREEEH